MSMVVGDREHEQLRLDPRHRRRGRCGRCGAGSAGTISAALSPLAARSAMAHASMDMVVALGVIYARFQDRAARFMRFFASAC